jgi:hypothetical protein
MRVLCLSGLQAPAASSSNAAANNPMARGKDGHLTLGLSNDDFFKDPLSMAGAQRSGSGGLGGTPKGGYGSNPGPFGGFGGSGMGAPKQAEVEPIAQKRFANAKAISSRCVAGACVAGAGGVLYMCVVVRRVMRWTSNTSAQHGEVALHKNIRPGP